MSDAAADADLRAIAETKAGRYADGVLQAAGWTRRELVAAILHRLRSKHGVEALPCPTPHKHEFDSRDEACQHRRRFKDHQTWPYECPSGDHWHLTSLTPAQQRARFTASAKGVAP